MKIRLIPSKTKWGKEMEKIIPQEILMFYAELLVKSLMIK